MSDTTEITLATVRHVAQLANLEPAESELPRLAQDLNAILGHIAKLSELDTTDVSPMAQVGATADTPISQHGETLRADTERPSLNRATVMSQAPETNGAFFKVPKVIER